MLEIFWCALGAQLLAIATAQNTTDVFGAPSSSTTTSSTSTSTSTETTLSTSPIASGSIESSTSTTSTAISAPSTGQNAQVVALAPAAQPTSGSSAIVSPSYAGFGIEPSNLFSFTGDATVNQLTINLLNNLANYTGTPPHLRIGGNTGDNMIYESSQDQWEAYLNPKPVGVGGWYPTDYYIIGPRYFEAINRFPSNTPITFGLNMAYRQADYLDRIIAEADAAYTMLTDVNLVSFEVGNEPDLWAEAGYRANGWDGQMYTNQWLTRANAVWENILKPNGERSNFFEPGCTASTIRTSFTVDSLIDDGVTQDAVGSSGPLVQSFNQHDYYYYIGVTEYALTIPIFMDLTTTETQFSWWTSETADSINAGYPFVLREMGVVGPIGMDGITNVFCAALWHLNFFLYSSTLNISSVQMHMTDNSNASAWQPIDHYGNEPFVRPNYYAWAAFDQTIGPTCQATVSRYDGLASPSPEYEGYFRAYSVYQNSVLASIVMINSKVANASETHKDSLTFDLTLPTEFAGQTLYLSYLTADGADSKHGTTWDGVSYETSGDGTPTVADDTIHSTTVGADGSVSVTVRDTQALVANIGSRIGTRTLNRAACASLAAKIPDATPIATNISTGGGQSGTGGGSGGGSGGGGQGSTNGGDGDQEGAATTSAGAASVWRICLATMVSAFFFGAALI